MDSTAGIRVIVVGAGIVGASLAYHLSRKGAQVTVVDSGEVASGVTARSFAWINTSHTGPDSVAPLRDAAIGDYRRLERELPDLTVRWTGSLSYDTSAVGALNTALRGSRSQIIALELHLRNPPPLAFHAPEEGALDAVEATRALIRGAQAQGARLLTQTRVVGFKGTKESVSGVETTQGILDADLVVLAAGIGISALANSLGVPLSLEASPAIFIRYRSPSSLVNAIVSNSAMEVRHSADGSLLAAEDYVDDAPENQPEAMARRTAEAISNELHGAAPLEPETACIGFRPIPRDGIPLIGHLPGISGVYVCVMHPGVTLAATVGRLVSEEIVDGKLSPDLLPCRLDRLLQT